MDLDHELDEQPLPDVIDIAASYGTPDETIDLGQGMAILRMPDGAWRFRHPCSPKLGRPSITAPALRIGTGHTIVAERPLTISPSILCPDCDTHGWVRHGHWLESR